jgi:hypothetical protein
MNYTMDNVSEGQLGTFALLLTDEYGGEEIHGGEFRAVKELLGVETAEEIILTCDEDTGSPEEYERFRRIVEKLKNSPELKSSEFDGGYDLYELEGVPVVYRYEEIEILFIRTCDREKFDAITDKI